jgi:hypothetical protein
VTTDNKSRAEVYLEEVEARKAEGMSNGDAARAVAEQHGKSVNAIRSSIHQYKTRRPHGDSDGRPRRRTTRRVEDHVDRARRSLHDALGLIDQEVADAKADLEAAQSHYDQLTASTEARKAEVEQRIKALS